MLKPFQSRGWDSRLPLSCCSHLTQPLFYPLVCRKEETVTVYPADVVLFEGILAFYSQEVRDLFQMKLFVDTDADTRLSRRGAFQKLPIAHRWPRVPGAQ